MKPSTTTRPVHDYAGRFIDALDVPVDESLVCSPLGCWLALATTASVVDEAATARIEEALGCDVATARSFVEDLLHDGPDGVAAAIALWGRDEHLRDALETRAGRAPLGAVVGPMPTQQNADRFAEVSTAGLIRSFPLVLDDLTSIVVASAMATKISWEQPLSVVPAAELGDGPWSDAIVGVLRSGDDDYASVVETTNAGLVAVHAITAREGIVVASVSAAPDVEPVAVLAAAHEVAQLVTAPRSTARWVSLFDLPAGPGHSWDIVEDMVEAEPGVAQIEGVRAVIPAWRADSGLALGRFPGVRDALAGLSAMLIDRGETHARQVAMAEFSREGFEAAQITSLSAASPVAPQPRDDRRPVPRRRAILRFGRPYAAVAAVARRLPPDEGGQRGGPAPMAGLPLFAAWVAEPSDAGEPTTQMQPIAASVDSPVSWPPRRRWWQRLLRAGPAGDECSSCGMSVPTRRAFCPRCGGRLGL